MLLQKKVVPLQSQNRGVEQLVARQAHNLEVACSSPASATNVKSDCFGLLFLTAFPYYYGTVIGKEHRPVGG